MEKEFQTIIQQHGNKLYRLCLAYLYDTTQVDDLYQEVLMNIWKSLKNFKGKSVITTWLFRITVNTAITYNRKEKKRQQLFTHEFPRQVAATPSFSNEREAQLKKRV